MDYNKLTPEEKERLRKQREQAWKNGPDSLKKMEKGVNGEEPPMFQKLRKMLGRG